MAVSIAVDRGNGLDRTRGCVRAGLQYFVATIARVVDMSGGHLIDGVILLTMLAANVGPLIEKDRAAFIAEDDIPPDDMRKPVSVYWLAKQLRLPYETARRHVQSLERAGLCIRLGREGYIVPQSSITQLGEKGDMKAMLRDLEDLVASLDGLGALSAAERSEPLRAANAGWIG